MPLGFGLCVWEYFMTSWKIIFTLLGIFLSGCSGLFYDPDRAIARHYETYNIAPPVSPYQFQTCNHYGCSGQARISLTDEQWQKIKELFSPAAQTALEERTMIAAAIGLMEQLVGLQSNTFADQACNNFREPIESFQLDCVAEATNATIYLQLFQQEGLLRWHQVRYPAQRDVLALFLQHFSAVIRQQDSAELFAVDSWFYANGEKAVVVPLKLWADNYYPGPCSANRQ
jgi:hypothetical protein